MTDAPAAATAAPPGADRLADLLGRVRAAGRDGANAAVSDADVAWLAGLGDGPQGDALYKLSAEGAQKAILNRRIKALRNPRQRFRVVGDDEAPPDWRAELRYNDHGDPLGSVDNALAIFRNGYADRLSYDLKGLRPCLDDHPLDDDGMTRLRGDVGARNGYSCSLQVGDFRAGVLAVAKEQRTFSPVADYLRSVRHDSTPRLATMARDHLRLEDPYSNMVLRRTMIAAVARGLVWEWAPHGFMVKTVPIILGYQDRKKSTFWQTLGTPQLRPWFGCSKVNVEIRQGPITLAAKWWYEFPEIDGWLSRHSNEAAKAWTAQPDDDFVAPYAASNTTQPRSFLVVGTTNKARFLTDPTGSSRWLVLDIRPNGPRWKVDVKRLRAALDQLYAEAVVEFDAYLRLRAEGVDDDQNPHRWWLSDDENDERARRNEEHQVESAWGPHVEAWLAGQPQTCPACQGSGKNGQCAPCTGSGKVTRGPLPTDALGREFTTTGQVLSECLGVPVERHVRLRAECADALEAIGWRAGERRVDVPLPNGRTSRATPHYRPDPPAEGAASRAAEARALADPAYVSRRMAELAPAAAELRGLDEAAERLAAKAEPSAYGPGAVVESGREGSEEGT